MAISLLSQLNALADKSPDEIALSIKPKPWYHFQTLTPEQFELLHDRKCVLAEWNPRRQEFDVSDKERGWDFWGNRSEEDRVYFRTELKNYFAIPLEDYRDGDLPTERP